MTGNDEDRQQLAKSLRALRERTRLSTTQFAKRVGWSQSKVSKSERGVTTLSPDDVETWARISEADAETAQRLVALAERAAAQLTEWRRALAPGRVRLQQEIHRLESAAGLTRIFASGVIVGLAQTESYAEVMFRIDRPPIPDDEIPGLVEARLARHEVLADSAKRFQFLMVETAARRKLLPAPEMRKQLQRLIELSHRPNIQIGVIPFDAEGQLHQYHGFAIIGDPERDDETMVRAETVTRLLTIRSPAEIAEYVAHFDALWSTALEGEALRAFLQEVIDDLDVS